MSLVKMNPMNVIKKQVQFKMNSFVGVFTSMVILQILAIVFSLSGAGGIGGGSDTYSYQYTFYSADTVIAFTLLWIFINAILIMTKAYQEDDFAFITNRLTQNIANMVFLVIASFIGGICAMMSTFLVKVLTYLFVESSAPFILNNTGVSEWITGLGATILFVLLASALGYFIGSIVQLHKMLAVLVPVIIIGGLIFLGSQEMYVLNWIGNFYFQEESFVIFIVKASVTIVGLFILSLLFSNRKEVRI